MADELNKGLRGVLVAGSSPSHIDGDAGKLIYRGYDIEDLAADASYEEVLYLLWEGHLPDRAELDAFAQSMVSERAVGKETLETLRLLAGTDETPMAALRSAVSTLSANEPEEDAAPADRDATRRKGRRVTAKIPTILAAFLRLRDGQEPIEPGDEPDETDGVQAGVVDIVALCGDDAAVAHRRPFRMCYQRPADVSPEEL